MDNSFKSSESLNELQTTDGGYDKPSEPTKEQIAKWEEEAKREISDFLSKKGIDGSAIDEYQIIVKPSRPRIRKSTDQPRKSELPGYNVQYVAPDGNYLTSKGDLLSDISDRLKRHLLKSSTASDGKHALRNNLFGEAKEKVSQLQLPSTIDNIKLVKLGKINSDENFHTSTQIYPVGYKCEQQITRGNMKHSIICEINESNNNIPEFCILNTTTKNSFYAYTESAVWKKVINDI